MIIEFCTESIVDANKAESNGANRIELCANLDVGGLTPNLEIISNLLDTIKIPVRIILRPTDSFTLTKEDFKSIEKSIDSFTNLDIEGFVFGYLNADNTIDIEATKKILALAPTKKWTFHKAIDSTRDILEATKSLEPYKQIDTILSSGGQEKAHDGLNTLLAMQSASSKTIMPGGSITWKNCDTFKLTKGFQALHGRRIVRI